MLISIILVLLAVTVWLFLERRILLQKVNLPPAPWAYSYYDAGNGEIGGYISAKGTWESNIKLAYPWNVNQVDCWKRWNTCIVAQAYTTGKNGIGRINLINSDLSYYDIESWDMNKVIAKNTALCAETVLTIDRTQKKMTTITTPINSDTEGCKSGADLLGEVEVETNILIDGSKKWLSTF